MNEEVQVIVEPKAKKKRFYQKWWFWVIVFLGVVIIAAGSSGEDTSNEGNEGKSTTTVTATKTSEKTPTEPTLSEEDYKASCSSYTYKELARNPDLYQGKKVALQGKVIQVIEDGNHIELRVNINGEYSDTIYVMYTKKENEGRILEDDMIKFYGSFEGLLTYTSILGAEITIPQVDAQYIDLVP